MHNKQINAVTNSGVSQSFIVPKLINELGLERQILGKGLVFPGISERLLVQREYAMGVKWHVNDHGCS